MEDIKEILKKSEEVLILAKHVTNLEPAKEHEIIRAKPVIRHNTITGLLSNFHSLTSDDFDDTVRSKSLRSFGLKILILFHKFEMYKKVLRKFISFINHIYS